MERTRRLPAPLLVIPFLVACAADPPSPNDPGSLEPETVQAIEIRVGETTEASGLVLALAEARRITRQGGEHLLVYRLAIGESVAIEGDSELFIDEAVASGKLVTILGWKREQTLSVRVEAAPSSPPLDEDGAGELAAAEAQRRGLDVDAHDASCELTRGEGALIYVLEEDERRLCRALVGLHSGTVLSFEAD